MVQPDVCHGAGLVYDVACGDTRVNLALGSGAQRTLSIYGYLNCHDCRQSLWLGKAIHEDYRPIFFHIGAEEESPNWKRATLNQIVWKFLADHCGHRIDTRLENAMTDEMLGYQDIGGDCDQDVSKTAYLDGWPGLKN